jgi:hypothetical protein
MSRERSHAADLLGVSRLVADAVSLRDEDWL